METVVGIFKSRDDSCRAASYLKSSGIPDNHLNVLMPGASEEELKTVPTTETEPPGVGAAIGGVVGGILGAAGGLSLATTAALLVPGVGPVVAVGLLGAGLLGVGGAVSGAVVGESLDEGMIEGLPKDDLFVYEDALRKGRSVVIAFISEGRQTDAVRKIMEQAGAEDVDAARENWWLGLRDAEEEYYAGAGRDFGTDEQTYRRGFEAALNRETRGKPYTDVTDYLKARYPSIYNEESFRHGYERGRVHTRTLSKSFEKSA
ncbi:MAG TPA: hypothetical protein VFF31_16200 [Blastocatellia bacterium]|nr:hypothetical protein [Blastocatellia bacterium]